MAVPEEHVEAVDVARVQSDRMRNFRSHVLERQEIVRHLRRSSHLTGSLETEDQKVEDEAVVLDDE